MSVRIFTGGDDGFFSTIAMKRPPYRLSNPPSMADHAISDVAQHRAPSSSHCEDIRRDIAEAF